MLDHNQPRRQVLPVIHHLDAETSCAQAELAFGAGAHGVFLISHDGRNDELAPIAIGIKSDFPDKVVGINFLGCGALSALQQVANAELDAVWADDPGVTSSYTSTEAKTIAKWLDDHPQGPVFFGSVAFKYQPHEPNPGEAAKKARALGMIPTTSGVGTGVPPVLKKIETMHESLEGGCLAVASGMIPLNIPIYRPFVSHYLVATGVSIDMHHFDPESLHQLCVQVETAPKQPVK